MRSAMKQTGRITDPAKAVTPTAQVEGLPSSFRLTTVGATLPPAPSQREGEAVLWRFTRHSRARGSSPPPSGRGPGGGSPRRKTSLLVLFLAFFLQAALAAEPVPLSARLENPAELQKLIAAGAKSLPALKEAVKGSRPDLAVHALGKIRSAKAVAILSPLAEAKDGELRALVAWALGKCATREATAVLVELARDPYHPVRAAGVMALAKLPGKEADEALRRAVRDPAASIRRSAVNAIHRNRRRDLFGLLLPLLDYRLVMQNEAAEGKPSKLVEAVVWNEPAKHVRLAAIQALGALKVVDGLPSLIQALEREESFNRLRIIEAIEGFGETAASVCLGRIVPLPYDKQSLGKHLPILVNNGVLAVIAGTLGDERCVPMLLDTLKLPRQSLGRDKDLTELYIETVRLLGKFRVQKAARHLVELLKQTQVRQLSEATQEAVRNIGRAAARPLARNLDDWQMVPIFLPLLRQKELHTSAARESLIKFLGHESDDVRLEAVETLGLYLAEGVLDEYDLPLLESMALDHKAEVRARCEHWRKRVEQRIGD